MPSRSFCAAVLATALVGGCHHDPPKALQAVRVERIAPVTQQSVTPYSGSALAATQVDLSFRVGGYVENIATVKDAHGATRRLQAGDWVETGTVLASLRESDYKAKLAELSGMRGDAASAYQRNKADFDRATTLLASGSISQGEYDNVKSRYLSSAGAGVAANARVSEASIALSDTRPRAPFRGMILSRSVEVGALVAPGTVAFTLADTTTMRIVFGVPDSVQRALVLDQPVTVSTDAINGRTFNGTLTKIAVQADPKTRVFDVEASVDNADQAIKVGMVMQVRIDVHNMSTPPAALIPLSAVVRPPTGANPQPAASSSTGSSPGSSSAPATGFAAYVVSETGDTYTAKLRVLALGDLVGNRVAVTTGLAVGDQIVVQGATLLTDGQQVSVVP